MKKPFSHNELSDKTCKTKHCNRKIKANLLAVKPDAEHCFKCWTAIQRGRGHVMKDHLRQEGSEQKDFNRDKRLKSKARKQRRDASREMADY